MDNNRSVKETENDVEKFIIQYSDGFIDMEEAESYFEPGSRVRQRVIDALEVFLNKGWTLRHLSKIQLDTFKSELEDEHITSPGKKTFEAFKDVINNYTVYFDNQMIGDPESKQKAINNYFSQGKINNSELENIRRAIAELRKEIGKLSERIGELTKEITILNNRTPNSSSDEPQEL